MALRKETELYPPVKAFLEQQGFAVKGEVRGCDLVALCGDETVIVELKSAFNLQLVLQGIDRQRLTDVVYLAVEAPRKKRSAPRWNDLLHLCRRLGLGLLTVSFGTCPPRVEVCCQPEAAAPRRKTGERKALLTEFKRRSTDANSGGSTRRPLVTAYREDALRLARHLREHGATRVKDLRAATGVTAAQQVLYGNAYGWFVREGAGIYGLTPAGEAALGTFGDVVADLVKVPD